MNTKTSTFRGIGIAATLAGLMVASALDAQQLDTRTVPRPSVQGASCADVTWNRDMLAQYPRIAEGCQEVVLSDGKKWARFEADFVRSNNNGSVTLDFKDRQDRTLDRLTLMPAAAQRVKIDGRDYRFSELSRGQTLNLYVPEGMYAVATEPGEPADELAKIEQPVQVAQAEPAEQLPHTAGPLPWFALAGLASVLAGLGLTMRRRFLAENT